MQEDDDLNFINENKSAMFLSKRLCANFSASEAWTSRDGIEEDQKIGIRSEIVVFTFSWDENGAERNLRDILLLPYRQKIERKFQLKNYVKKIQ